MKIDDQAMLQRLEAQEQSAYRWRFINIAVGIACFAVAIGGFAFLLTISREKAMMFGRHPMMYIMAMAGGVCIGYGVRGWRGDPAKRLLISLARSQLTARHGVQPGAQPEVPEKLGHSG